MDPGKIPTKVVWRMERRKASVVTQSSGLRGYSVDTLHGKRESGGILSSRWSKHLSKAQRWESPGMGKSSGLVLPDCDHDELLKLRMLQNLNSNLTK